LIGNEFLSIRITSNGDFVISYSGNVLSEENGFFITNWLKKNQSTGYWFILPSWPTVDTNTFRCRWVTRLPVCSFAPTSGRVSRDRAIKQSISRQGECKQSLESIRGAERDPIPINRPTQVSKFNEPAGQDNQKTLEIRLEISRVD